MEKVLLIVTILLVKTSCYASDIQLGFLAGANYSNYQWNTATPGAGFSTTGYNGTGGILLSFFQSQKFGFRISGFENYVSSTGPGSGSLSNQTATITGTVPAAAITFNYNFDIGGNRHSIGIGYGYESFTSLSCTGTVTFPKSTSGGGLVADIKDFWKSGTFGYAEAFLPVDNLTAFNLIATLVVGVGYDFGSSK